MAAETVQQSFELAVQHHQAGRLAEAEALYRQILAVRPGFAEAHNNLGIVLSARGQWAEAMAAYHRALQFQPDNAEIHNNLGISLFERGSLDEAITAYRRALQLRPTHTNAHCNLGNALRDRGEFEEAIIECRRAIELQPNLAVAHNNLGNALQDQGRFDEAVGAYRRAIQLDSNYAAAHSNLGNALRQQGKLDESIAACRHAIQIRPDIAEAHSNLGNALKDEGALDDAIASYRRALQIRPTSAAIHSNLIYALHFSSPQKAQAVAEECERWNRHFDAPAKRCLRPHANDPDPDRRLRIGYVSSDFRDHVVGSNLRPLFGSQDYTDFEIFCYSGVLQPDSFTNEFREHADQWRSVARVSEDALADMIHQDRVDILVDLTQHMASNRLPVFARKPAPVQVSFAGYPESTGVEAIEYRISDPYLESQNKIGDWEIGWKNESDEASEHVFLIDSFWCYDPCGMKVADNELPAKENGHITVGCLNNFCKVNEPMLKLWARVLRQVPDSRLVILSGFGSHRQQTLDFLAHEGVASERVEFVEPRPRKEYLELYHRLDIVLDTFPYNGHTTSLDALWMGVPVVSLCGERPVSRAGLSQLSNLGLAELVAFSEDDYVKIATELANNLPRLAELRRTLRGRMEASVLMDAPRFARNIEAAYRSMWRRWCAENTDP